MVDSFFVDSNVILYLLDQDIVKSKKAATLISKRGYINSQVIAEVLNVTRRVYKYSKDDLLIFWKYLIEDIEVVPVSIEAKKNAIELIKIYDFQIFDAIIIASAL